MADNPTITGIETIQFKQKHPRGEVTLKGPIWKFANAVRVTTDQGVTGEYVGGWGMDHDAIGYVSHLLVGQNALDRLGAYQRCRHASRHGGRLGYSVVDVALWDLAGKWHGAPVYQLLGAEKRRLPAYASTSLGDDDPNAGLGTPDAYADFAERCLEIGYKAFKIHGWLGGDVQREIDTAISVGERVGDRMGLMDDVSSSLLTLNDAIRLGQVLDAYSYVWYEDPYADTGVSATGHRLLRERVKTPLLITEHHRGLEQKVDFFLSGGTDFLRADPDLDGGITGAMKIASAAEGLGTDVEIHFTGPAHRHCMTAMRNSNYYEMALVHPDYDFTSPSTGIAAGYSDGLESVDADGCVEAPDGDGLGVEYDWEYINHHRVGGTSWGISSD